jgi:hypothetical protein
MTYDGACSQDPWVPFGIKKVIVFNMLQVYLRYE